MQVDSIIVGQGICGTWLSYYLKKQGKTVLVIDRDDKNSSSRIAAGVINPVTGRRHVEVWLASQLLPFVRAAYSELNDELGIESFHETSLIDFFPSPQMRQSFVQRVSEKKDYLEVQEDSHRFDIHFKYEFGSGEIRPVFIINLEQILPAWKKVLQLGNQYLGETFDFSKLKLETGQVNYNDIKANSIIFCDGARGAENPFFSLLPFAPNKGQILIAEIPGLPVNHIYKKGMVMVPVAKEKWWIGSDYNWEFSHTEPTKEFREKTEALLNNWLQLPYQITEHLAGVRPATVERRPFAGFHPLYKNVGILNGMGTKGCSLAPYFANELCHHICHGQAITPEADVKRFTGILSRSK